MTVRIEKPAATLAALLAKLRGQPAPETTTFWFSGDSTETDFTINAGWKVENVFVNGSLYRPGSGEDYTVEYGGFQETVVFAVAPGVVDIGITAKRIVS